MRNFFIYLMMSCSIISFSQEKVTESYWYDGFTDVYYDSNDNSLVIVDSVFCKKAYTNVTFNTQSDLKKALKNMSTVKDSVFAYKHFAAKHFKIKSSIGSSFSDINRLHIDQDSVSLRKSLSGLRKINFSKELEANTFCTFSNALESNFLIDIGSYAFFINKYTNFYMLELVSFDCLLAKSEKIENGISFFYSKVSDKIILLYNGITLSLVTVIDS